MIYMPPSHIIKHYLRPNNLPDKLIDTIPCRRFVGPGETKPMFPKPVVERFIEDHLSSKSNEERRFALAEPNRTDPLQRIATALERVAEAVVPRAAGRADAGVEMLTPTEAAKQMKLHVQTVREWCREGKLGVRAGRRWLINPGEVKQYLRGQLIKGRLVG